MDCLPTALLHVCNRVRQQDGVRCEAHALLCDDCFYVLFTRFDIELIALIIPVFAALLHALCDFLCCRHFIKAVCDFFSSFLRSRHL